VSKGERFKDASQEGREGLRMRVSKRMRFGDASE